MQERSRRPQTLRGIERDGPAGVYPRESALFAENILLIRGARGALIESAERLRVVCVAASTSEQKIHSLALVATRTGKRWRKGA
jgi:hypothetical protein